MDAQEFRRLGHALVEWVANYREHMAELPVMSQVQPGEVKRALPETMPEKGASLDTLLPLLDQVVMPGITHWNHPGFFAYFPSNTPFSSILADLVTAGLGAQGMSWQTSPAATEVEVRMMEWLRQLVGLSPAFQGVIHDTASTATLTALLCARERTTKFSQSNGGLQGAEKPLVVYASEMAHSSVEKAALLAGFGREHLRLIETDGAHALNPAALARAMEEDLARGRVPCAIVASVGTTGTTAVDPLEPLAALAEQHAAWLHVDAALAGTAMVVPACRVHWQGVERADSLVLNPHKWMGAGFDCSAYFVRDPEHLIRVMSTQPSYLLTPHDAEVPNLRDWQIPLGRRFRALKLWFLFHELGAEGLRARIQRDLDNAQWLASQVDAAADFERVAPVPFQTVCLRHLPPGISGAALDEHNRGLVERLNAEGRIYLTSAVVKGQRIIRFSLGVETAGRDEVARGWGELVRAARLQG